MARSRCDDADLECPYRQKIEDAYTKLVTGNGDLPILERVRKLEDSMTEAVPILSKVNEFFILEHDRKERNAKSWQWFRWIVGTLIAAGLLFVGIMEARRAFILGQMNQPKITIPQIKGELHVATANQPTDATIAPPYQSGVTYVY